MTQGLLAGEQSGTRWSRILGWGGLAAAMLLNAAHFVIRLSPAISGPNPPPLSVPDFIPSVPLIGFALVGAFIVTRIPRQRYGWLCVVIAVLATFPPLLHDYAYVALANPGRALPAGQWAAWLWGWFAVLVTISAPPTLFLAPWGTLPSRRWRPVFAAALAISPIAAIAAAVAPGPIPSLPAVNPLGWNGAVPVAYIILAALFPLLAVAQTLGLFSLIARYRAANGAEQQQLRPLVYLAVLVPFEFAVQAADMVTQHSVMWLAIADAIYTPFGILTFVPAIAISVFKYRLYDIDVFINRALVYGSLAAFITAVYVAIVVGIGAVIGSGAQPNLVLSIVATAIVAVAFQPVRERVQKVANRLIYGNRATPYEVLSQFSERVAESYAADEVLGRMAMVLAEGTGADRATVWLRSGDALRPTATHPPGPDGQSTLAVTSDELPEISGVDRAVPVRHQGALLGALTVAKRKGEPLTPVEQKLVDDLANQAGLVLKNVRLTSDLLQSIEDLRASRQRLVAAQDEERRRLERNLHDGAQQNLVALKVKLGLAEALAERDPARARDLIGQLKGDADETLDVLRDLARGIYPPLLADKGLSAAIEAQARKATIPVDVDAGGLGRYPQDREAAVYFCCLEALQNIQKYAEATRVTVRLKQVDAHLRFEVEDDGKGFDPATQKKGAGLQNMEDRLDALGGGITLVSAPGQGTRLTGILPAG